MWEATKAKNPKYTKSNPIKYEYFIEIEKWLKKKTSNDNAWKVSVNDISNFNLDVNNPLEKKESINLSPHKLIDNIIEDEARTMKLLWEIKDLITKEIPK